MPDENTLISVVAVLENDGDILESWVAETVEVLSPWYQFFEILVVDNGSTDDTASRTRALHEQVPSLRLIRLSRRHEREIALAAALEHSVGDYVVLMEPVWDPPSLIPELLAQAAAGHDIVIAERRSRAGEPWFRRKAAAAFYWLAGRVWGEPMRPNASNFRVLSRRVVNSIVQIRNKRRYLKFLSVVVGFSRAFLPYDRVHRRPGKARPSGTWESVLLAIDILISNSAAPLRFASLLGLTASALSLAFFGYVLVVAVVKDNVIEGWVTTNIVTACLFFALFLIVAVLAEYVARLLEESRDRPLYFIEDESTSPVEQFKAEIEAERGNVV